MKKNCFILSVFLIISTFSAGNVFAAGKQKEPVIGLLAGMGYALFLPFILPDEGGTIDCSWGARDAGAGLGYFPEFKTLDDNDQAITEKGIGLYMSTMVIWKYQRNWFGFLSPGFEFVGDSMLSWGKDPDSSTDTSTIQTWNFSVGGGPNFTFLEIPDVVRLRCGAGYIFSFQRLVNLYVHPSIDFKVTSFFTLNAGMFQSFYGTPFDEGRSKWRMMELGGSYVFNVDGIPHNIAVRWFNDKTSRNGTADGYKLNGFMLAYTFGL